LLSLHKYLLTLATDERTLQIIEYAVSTLDEKEAILYFGGCGF